MSFRVVVVVVVSVYETRFVYCAALCDITVALLLVTEEEEGTVVFLFSVLSCSYLKTQLSLPFCVVMAPTCRPVLD